jgi:hypothetical protein
MAETVGGAGARARYRARVNRYVLLGVLAACGHPASPAEPDAALAGDAPAADAAAIDAAALDAPACTPTAATELCDGVLDENCDGAVDEGCTNDPFDPASCGGPPPTAAEALALLGALTRSPLATATIQVRSRTCNGTACDPWSAASNWQTRYLTYSGGVTTRYMNLQADTRIVLYKSGAVPKLSVQHVTFTQGNYPDSMGMVFEIPPVDVTYPVLRAFNVAPLFPSDYEDLELTLKNGALVLGTRCARFTATSFGQAEPFTTGYAALYRW